MVSMQVIAQCAGKGELLPVCFTEGGVHSDLALFLGSDVHPIRPGGTGASNCQQHGKKGSTLADADGEAGLDGFVAVGGDPLSSTTIVLKPGFRLILFESSSSSTSFSCSPSSSSSLLFLQDSPEALARIQLVRFGGVDCVGVKACDDGVKCLARADREMGKGGDGGLDSTEDGGTSSASSSDEDSSSSESIAAHNAPLPTFVLAGMGLIRQPGFEMSKTLGARLQEEITRAFPLDSVKNAPEQRQTGDAAASLATAQREALSYSSQLSASHEAVIALLAARPPSFNAGEQTCAPDVTVPSGGEPTTGVSDDVERDQNRVLNNLIETLFAYKGILEKGLDTVSECGRASQAKLARAARKAEEVAHNLTSSALRLLARSGDMLHAWGLDPVLYSPTFPGVRALVQGAIRSAADDTGPHTDDGQQALERAIVVGLACSMATRVNNDCKWVFPLAALALTSPGDFPAIGWWDTCVALVGDRNGAIDNPRGSESRLRLAKLFEMVMSPDTRAGGWLAKDEPKREHGPGDDQEILEACAEKATEKGVINPGLVEVRELVGSWVEFYEVEVPNLTEVAGPGLDCADDDSANSGDDVELTRSGVKLSPQHWDLGFDTSGWTGDRGAAAVEALARDRGIPMGVKAGVEDTDRRGGEESESKAFFSALSQLWSTATAERAMMNAFQAAEAKAFSGDDVLRRLVLMEATMNGIFKRLPGYVMCEAGRWIEWVAEVRRTLVEVEEEGGNSTTKSSLRFLLSHPPPSFESKTNMDEDAPSPSSSSSSSDEESDSSDGSSSSNSGSGSGEESDKEKATNDSLISSSLGTSIAIAGEVKPLDVLAPHNKVRRDSRERMKIKLGLLDELGMAVGGEESQNDLSVKEECNSRARSLFGISTSQTRGVTSAKKLPSPVNASSPAAYSNEHPRSDPADKAAKTTMVIPKSSPSVNIDENDDADQVEDCQFITFVAESFRPQRDNSDWHREAIRDPVPLDLSSNTTRNTASAVADHEPIESATKAAAVAVDELPAVGNETAADGDDTVDMGQQLEAPSTSSPQYLADGTHSDAGSSSKALPDHAAIETALTEQELDTRAQKVAKKYRYGSKAFSHVSPPPPH